MTGKFIYIASPRRFQYQLLSYFLTQEARAKCLHIENLQDLPETRDESNEPPVLIFVDCLGKNRENILDELTSDGRVLEMGCPLCLFNLRRGMGIESKAIEDGVHGFFYEYDPLENFIKGIDVVCSGELWASRRIMSQYVLKNNKKLQNNNFERGALALTQREIEILSLIAVGTSNAEAAEKLCISPHTVKTHVHNIFKKINVPNRLQATLWASKNL